jgi:hypothetical protein
VPAGWIATRNVADLCPDTAPDVAPDVAIDGPSAIIEAADTNRKAALFRCGIARATSNPGSDCDGLNP